MIKLYLDTHYGVKPIPVDIDIVIPEIPSLFCLDVHDRERITREVAYNVLSKRLKVTDDNGQTLYVEDW